MEKNGADPLGFCAEFGCNRQLSKKCWSLTSKDFLSQTPPLDTRAVAQNIVDSRVPFVAHIYSSKGIKCMLRRPGKEKRNPRHTCLYKSCANHHIVRQGHLPMWLQIYGPCRDLLLQAVQASRRQPLLPEEPTYSIETSAVELQSMPRPKKGNPVVYLVYEATCS